MADSGKLLSAPAAHSRVAQSKPKKVHYPFWFGGSASCFAAGVTHPLDLGMCSYNMYMWLLSADFTPAVKVSFSSAPGDMSESSQ